MKKFMSFVLTGAIALSGGVYCTGSTPDFSAFSEDYTEITYENVKYNKYADHVEVGNNKDNKELTEVVIPDEIEGLPVTEIGDSAFEYCENLKSVKFPKNIKRIGNSAFLCCGSLELNEIPNTVTEIGYYAFYFCNSLESVTIPDSVTSIGAAAFYGLSITSVTIPNSITKIEPMTFYYCEDLESITIPDSVTEIGDNAFQGCSGLASVTIPDSVTKISNGTFVNCSNLKSVIIPDSVTKIGIYAFIGCSSLTSVSVPDSVTEIGGSAFSNCANLKSITIENPDCEISDYEDTICNSQGGYDFESGTTFGTVFDGTIYGYTGSTAQAYAEKYGYKFETIGEQPTTEALKGDANGDNSVTIADAVAILQYLANSDEYPLSEQGTKNSDVLGDDGVNTEDALQIQKLDAGVIDKL